MKDKTWDVVVVGFGPAGATAANLLGAQGLRVLVVERDVEIFPRQRAISIDDEALRTIRGMGLYDAATATMHLGVPVEFVGGDGRPFLQFTPKITESCGEAQINFFHQPALEGVLRAGVARYPSVEVWAGRTMTGLRQDAACVEIDIIDGEGTTQTVSAPWVLACDGGSSAVRKTLGIPFSGSSYAEQWVDVQARVLQPFDASPKFRFVCSVDHAGVECPCPGGFRRWEWRVNKGETAADLLQPEYIWKRLAARGVTPADIEITRTWEYTFHLRSADRWRDGRVLLVGDAAHVMPPFAGQGISGAFRDAANVCWKLAEVARGRADRSLLDTYQQERHEHHLSMADSAVTLGRLVMPRNRAIAKLQEGVFRVLRHLPGFEKGLGDRIVASQPLREGHFDRTGDHPAVGRLLPSVRVARPDGVHVRIDEELTGSYAILGLDEDPRTTMAPDTLASWEAIGARFITLRSGTSVVAEGELGDPVGALWAWKKTDPWRTLVVRPDGYVYAAARTGSRAR